MTHLHIYRKHVVKATFVVGDILVHLMHLAAKPAFSETVEALSIVIEGYKTNCCSKFAMDAQKLLNTPIVTVR